MYMFLCIWKVKKRSIILSLKHVDVIEIARHEVCTGGILGKAKSALDLPQVDLTRIKRAK